MRKFFLTTFQAMACLMTLTVLSASANEPLTEETFQRLHAELQPAPDEPWRTIPWKITVLEAQEEAAREHKPIFIWAMDGHPLGCT